MGLKRDVIILIYYVSNGLTFEILNIILRYIILRLIIDGEINEKHALLVSA